MTHLARSPEQIGTLIRRQRHMRALTQKQLADLLGIRQATISAVEAGNPGVKLSTLLDILAALDLELSIGTRSKGAASDIVDVFS